MSEVLNSLYQRYYALLGTEIAHGEWLLIDQDRINRFAAVTGDTQWIHIEPEQATIESPFHGTIAHGFLTLSLLPYLTGSNTPEYFTSNYPGMRYRVNYGLNKVRFPAVVRPGDSIRAHTSIQSCRQLTDCLEITYLLTVEIQDMPKPACVVEQVFRVYP